MNQRSLDTLGQIRTVQSLIAIELSNWKQTQRMFITDDDRGKTELNSIQQWCSLFPSSLSLSLSLISLVSFSLFHNLGKPFMGGIFKN